MRHTRPVGAKSMWASQLRATLTDAADVVRERAILDRVGGELVQRHTQGLRRRRRDLDRRAGHRNARFTQVAERGDLRANRSSSSTFAQLLLTNRS